MRKLRIWGASGLLLLLTQVGGCPPTVVISNGLRQLEQAVVVSQVVDPRDVVLPSALVLQDDSVVLEPDVVVVADIETQLVAVDLAADTVLGFVNNTGVDLFIEFLAEGVLQDVYVFADETLLLDYPCLADVELLASIEVDPPTGELIATTDLSGFFFLNPDDFLCGDAVLLTFDPELVSIGLDVIPLAG